MLLFPERFINITHERIFSSEKHCVFPGGCRKGQTEKRNEPAGNHYEGLRQARRWSRISCIIRQEKYLPPLLPPVIFSPSFFSLCEGMFPDRQERPCIFF